MSSFIEHSSDYQFQESVSQPKRQEVKGFSEKYLFEDSWQYNKLDPKQTTAHNKSFAINSVNEKILSSRQSHYNSRVNDVRNPDIASQVNLHQMKAIMHDSSIKTIKETGSTLQLYPLQEDASARWLDQTKYMNSLRQTKFQKVVPIPRQFETEELLQNKQQEYAMQSMSRVLQSQTSLRNVTDSVSKMKQLREETTHWSSVDQNLHFTHRGSTKAFPSRLETKDPMSFSMNLKSSGDLRVNLNELKVNNSPFLRLNSVNDRAEQNYVPEYRQTEATRLNRSSRETYQIQKSDGGLHVQSKNVTDVLRPIPKFKIANFTSRKYQPPTSTSMLLKSIPQNCQPKSQSRVNNQEYNLITHQHSASKLPLVHRPTTEYLNYNVCGIMQAQSISSPRYRESYKSAFNQDQTVFRKQDGDLTKHLDSGKTAITRVHHIPRIIRSPH